MPQRIVLKVGSSSLTYATGKLNLGRIEALARELADLSNEGHEIVLVTSGAQAAGMGRLGLASKPQGVPERQAIAAIGQGLLMQIYEKVFSEYGKTVAQVLLTREDLNERRRYLNARNAMGSLFAYGAIPIINENDTVAVDELCFGENDTLSALVASLVDADLLLILSDIEGLYTADPKTHPEATLIAEVSEITQEIEGLAGGAGSGIGTGGMYSKVQAAKIATASGIPMVIAHSLQADVARRIVRGERVGTLFAPRHSRPVNRKRWLLFGRPVRGTIVVDEGACQAIMQDGRSLLPGGVSNVSGEFGAGDVVMIASAGHHEIARGVANYSRADLDMIRGRKSSDIELVLGYRTTDEVVHRDNLICL